MDTHPDNTVHDDDLIDQMSQTSKAMVDRPVLIFLEDQEMKNRIRLEKAVMTMGRDATADIVVDDSKCSRYHAKLLYRNFDRPQDPPEVILVDQKSTNGTYVNGERVDERILCDRDKILIGSALIGFFLRNETELEADERLYLMANHDSLTGLRNRRVFDHEIHSEFDRALRYRRDLSLVLFDIDHFKAFNDNHGHQMGDRVLRQIGRLAAGKIRSNDLATRYGGEEFAIILPETALEGALIQAERLRREVAAYPFGTEEEPLSVTISVGAAGIQPGQRQADDLIALADKALYQAKAQGRNRVCWARDGKFEFKVPA